MSNSYTAPLDDTLFILEHVIRWQTLFDLPAYRHVESDLARAVLTEGAKFCEQVLGPINAVGDEQGSVIQGGKVKTPDGFREAYKSFTAAGWPGLDMPEEFGGQQLPLTVQVAFAEMLNGACLSFAMLPLMLRAASRLLIDHADEELKQRVVPRLVTGDWGATICISEAQAGSDVGRIKTMAEIQADGSYRLTGTKVFITYADHDLTGQIIHLVLARTPGAPPGTRGISLFLVPKLMFDGGQANGVRVERLEKKMGLKASPTCVMRLEGATGYRIGEENRGLNAMFTMVNLMRLEVSVQGPAIGAAATAKALKYAAERPQGGAPDAGAVSIIEHADVKRMLLLMHCRTMAMRALVFEAASNLDLARHGGDEDSRQQALQLAEFLLPVCKACGSETGFDVASLAVQVFGGHGYITESGVEQYVRDVRVAAIYEGTNGIQALDLVTRKLLRDQGARFQALTGKIAATLADTSAVEPVEQIYQATQTGLAVLERTTRHVLQMAADQRRRDIEFIAKDYCLLAGLVAGAWMWLRIAHATGEYDRDKLLNNINCARFYAEYLMPEMHTLAHRINISFSEMEG